MRDFDPGSAMSETLDMADLHLLEAFDAAGISLESPRWHGPTEADPEP